MARRAQGQVREGLKQEGRGVQASAPSIRGQPAARCLPYAPSLRLYHALCSRARLCLAPRYVATSHRARLILGVVATDTSFARASVRGEDAWVGRCIHCRTKLVVASTGQTGPEVTIEHIVPRTHGGTDAPENLALACARCNAEKGVRHDVRRRADPRRLELERELVERRRARWREPAAASRPEGGGKRA